LQSAAYFISRKASVTGAIMIAMMNAMIATNKLIVASQMTSKRHRANNRARGTIGAMYPEQTQKVSPETHAAMQAIACK